MPKPTVLKNIAVFGFCAVTACAAPPADSHATTTGFDSVFVPLDSWVYPALYRLAGMGYMPDQFSKYGAVDAR